MRLTTEHVAVCEIVARRQEHRQSMEGEARKGAERGDEASLLALAVDRIISRWPLAQRTDCWWSTSLVHAWSFALFGVCRTMHAPCHLTCHRISSSLNAHL